MLCLYFFSRGTTLGSLFLVSQLFLNQPAPSPPTCSTGVGEVSPLVTKNVCFLLTHSAGPPLPPSLWTWWGGFVDLCPLQSCLSLRGLGICWWSGMGRARMCIFHWDPGIAAGILWSDSPVNGSYTFLPILPLIMFGYEVVEVVRLFSGDFSLNERGSFWEILSKDPCQPDLIALVFLKDPL